MILAAAFLLALQAKPAAPAPPPPPVLMTPGGAQAFLGTLPRIVVDGRGYRIFALQATGPRALLDAAAAKLKGEGWACDVLTDRFGTLQLGVYGEKHSLAEMQTLAARFVAGEFGAVEAKPMLFAEPEPASDGRK